MMLAFAARRASLSRIVVGLVLSILLGMFALQPASAALEPGTNAIVRTDDGTCLRLRAQPSLQGTIVACAPEGSTVQVLTGSTPGDGFQWQRIQYGAQVGWSVDQYLAASASPASPAQPPAPAAPTALPAPALNGSLPSGGGFGLAVWSGGPIDRIPPLAASMGCALRAVWVTQSGEFVGYVYGAPNVVNERWNGTYPAGALAANSPIIAVCAASGTTLPRPLPPSEGPPPGPIATPGVPPGVPNTPPGPAGNG